MPLIGLVYGEVRPSDITVDEAMSFILSGGAVAPKRFEERAGG